MLSRLALLILSVAAGAAVAVSGLYFGTDLFQRDPLAGMEPEPAVELAVAELSPAGAEEIVVAEEASGAALAEAEAAPSPALAEPVEVVSGARSLGARPASQTDVSDVAVLPANIAESADAARADEARRERPKGWKTHHALLTFAEPAETAQGGLAGGHAARLVFGQASREARFFRQRVRPVRGDAADSMEDPDPATVSTDTALGWKPHYPMRDLAQAIGQVEVPSASVPRAEEPRIEEIEISPALAGRGEEAREFPPARPETAEKVELASLQPEAVLGWKTHYAVPPAVRDATGLDEEMQPRPASIDAADPAPVPPRIAVETVEFEAPDGVTVSGRAEPGARVRVYLEDEGASQAGDARGMLGQARGDQDGMWQVNGTRALPPGRYRVYAEIRDAEDRTIASAERRFDRVEVVMAEEPAPVPPAEGGLADRLAELPALDEAPEAQSAAGPTTVHIERGDNLWHIAEAIYGNGLRYHDIYAFNRSQINDPDLIYPGQIFTVPVLEGAD